jgi:hypothetical protein
MPNIATDSAATPHKRVQLQARFTDWFMGFTPDIHGSTPRRGAHLTMRFDRIGARVFQKKCPGRSEQPLRHDQSDRRRTGARSWLNEATECCLQGCGEWAGRSNRAGLTTGTNGGLDIVESANDDLT